MGYIYMYNKLLSKQQRKSYFKGGERVFIFLYLGASNSFAEMFHVPIVYKYQKRRGANVCEIGTL